MAATRFDPNKPRLRKSLDINPVLHEGQRLFAVRDPLDIAPDLILVPAEVLFLMSLMDGGSTILDLQVAFTRRFGELIHSDTIKKIVNDLEQRGYMEGPALWDKLCAVEDAYRRVEVREAYHSGQAYPGEAAELRNLLDQALRSAAAPSDGPRAARPPRGIVAPHIDIGRGLAIYGRAYRELIGTPPPHTAVIFGTGHNADGNTYILTVKDFATPLGRAAADREFCERLVQGCPFDIRRGELAHRTEHSIEFQVLFLQHLFGARTPRIVPILCTAFETGGESGAGDCGVPAEERAGHLVPEPARLAQVRSFLAALEGAALACPGAVLLIAGADMCHVGPRFGGPLPLDGGALARVREEDTRALEAGAAGGADSFYRTILEVGNRNNICGVVSIYTVLKACDGARADLLAYDMAVEADGSAAVGFAALRVE